MPPAHATATQSSNSFNTAPSGNVPYHNTLRASNLVLPAGFDASRLPPAVNVEHLAEFTLPVGDRHQAELGVSLYAWVLHRGEPWQIDVLLKDSPGTGGTMVEWIAREASRQAVNHFLTANRKFSSTCQSFL